MNKNSCVKSTTRGLRLGLAAAVLASLSTLGCTLLPIGDGAAHAVTLPGTGLSCPASTSIGPPVAAVQSNGSALVTVTGCSTSLNSVLVKVTDPQSGAVVGEATVVPTCPSISAGVCIPGHFPEFSVTTTVTDPNWSFTTAQPSTRVSLNVVAYGGPLYQASNTESLTLDGYKPMR